jgi:hypothetical protein
VVALAYPCERYRHAIASGFEEPAGLAPLPFRLAGRRSSVALEGDCLEIVGRMPMRIAPATDASTAA